MGGVYATARAGAPVGGRPVADPREPIPEAVSKAADKADKTMDKAADKVTGTEKK